MFVSFRKVLYFVNRAQTAAFDGRGERQKKRKRKHVVDQLLDTEEVDDRVVVCDNPPPR